MNFIQQNQQDEQNYQEAVRKFYDLNEAIDKLKPHYKDRLFKEIINASAINHFLNIIKGGGY